MYEIVKGKPTLVCIVWIPALEVVLLRGRQALCINNSKGRELIRSFTNRNAHTPQSMTTTK